MPNLQILQGPDKGASFSIDDSPIIIGRNSPDLPLTDNTISRRHSELTCVDNTWYISDLQSANGTYVNGVKVLEPMALKQGDQVRCGTTIIVFGGKRSATVTGLTSGLKIDENGNLVEAAIVATMPSMDDSIILAGPESSAAVNNLRLLYQLSTAISSIFDTRQLLEQVMDMIFDNLPADRGFILINESGDESNMAPAVVRYRSPEHSGEITVSNTIVSHVVSHKEGVMCSNAMRDPRFTMGQSVHDLGVRSALCVPIMVRNHIIGAIYIDTTVATHTYANDQLQLLTAIGMQTGMALEHARLYQTGVQAERLAATGETVAYISHGIKNILQSLQSAADTVELGLGRDKIDVARKGWSILQRNLTRIQNLVLNMLAFSKERRPQLVMTQVNQIVSETVETLAGQALDKQVALFGDTDPELPAIAIDGSGLEQALLNLILNALDAVRPGEGVITVKTAYDEESQEVLVSVGDNGTGIAPEAQEKIFEAFHSHKGQGGTGLGLAVVRKIMEEHKGSVEVSSEAGQGTMFTMRFPCSTEETSDSGSTAGP